MDRPAKPIYGPVETILGGGCRRRAGGGRIWCPRHRIQPLEKEEHLVATPGKAGSSTGSPDLVSTASDLAHIGGGAPRCHCGLPQAPSAATRPPWL